MKDIKLSFPFPRTSRHNLSQDVSTSLSMGLVTPVRIVKVLPGDSHRIMTKFSLISNPLVKPLLQGLNMRYCRFWVPSRIYNLDQRANNSNFDPLNQPVRVGSMGSPSFPAVDGESGSTFYSNYQQSSLWDYLGLAAIESNFISSAPIPDRSTALASPSSSAFNYFNAEPYLAYLDICRNYFADSATGLIAWSSRIAPVSSQVTPLPRLGVCVSPLAALDTYIDEVQNSRSFIKPYKWFDPTVTAPFSSFILRSGQNPIGSFTPVGPGTDYFSRNDFGVSHNGLCIPLNRPDRLSRLFDMRTLTSQNATISPSEISIGNLSFLSKLQRYLTRRFFGGSRYTDIMYSVFGQKVPHVDSPVLLDVFDFEIGSELVASTNATESQNPGVVGGYLSASGILSTSRRGSMKRYTFNENGYLFDVVYILPRLNRTAFYPDFYPVSKISGTDLYAMSQGNFVPDFNGVGWQQPAFGSKFVLINNDYSLGNPIAFGSEASWQQYRTLPDVCHGALNPLRGLPSGVSAFQPVSSSLELNSPLFTFNDRPDGFTFFENGSSINARLLAHFYFSDFNQLNRVFGTSELRMDNIFVKFAYAHYAKRQVSKRFTLTFN